MLGLFIYLKIVLSILRTIWAASQTKTFINKLLCYIYGLGGEPMVMACNWISGLWGSISILFCIVYSVCLISFSVLLTLYPHSFSINICNWSFFVTFRATTCKQLLQRISFITRKDTMNRWRNLELKGKLCSGIELVTEQNIVNISVYCAGL